MAAVGAESTLVTYPVALCHSESIEGRVGPNWIGPNDMARYQCAVSGIVVLVECRARHRRSAGGPTEASSAEDQLGRSCRRNRVVLVLRDSRDLFSHLRLQQPRSRLSAKAVLLRVWDVGTVGRNGGFGEISSVAHWASFTMIDVTRRLHS